MIDSLRGAVPRFVSQGVQTWAGMHLNAFCPGVSQPLLSGAGAGLMTTGSMPRIVYQPRRPADGEGHYCRRFTRMQAGEGDRSEEAREAVWRPATNRREGMSRRGVVAGVWSAGLAAALSSIVGGVQPALAAGGIKDYEVPGVGYKTKSGLTYYDVRQGQGVTPKWGQVTIFHYDAYVRASPDSRLVLFDDTYSANAPYVHKHGNGRVIRGLDEGMHTMKLGGLRRVVIPLEQGFTKIGLGPLPGSGLRRKVLARELAKAEESVPRGELVYDLELVSVYDDEADLGYYEDVTFDSDFLRQGVIDAMQDLRDRGVKIPSIKEAAIVKPEILSAPIIDESPTTVFRSGPY